VLLVDRRGPGQETSHGNAGLVQREAVQPYPFPQDLRYLLDAALGRGAAVHWQAGGLLPALPALLRYWWHSRPAAHARATLAYSQLIAHSTDEHAPLMAAADAGHLVLHQGFRYAFRTPQALDLALANAQALQAQYGVQFTAEDSQALAAAEPALQRRLAGALHWRQPWAVSDPGALVQRYAQLFVQRGGELVVGDATTLAAAGQGWAVHTAAGRHEAAQAVLALGPWSHALVRRLGYRMPLFIKRGYHQHYTAPHSLNQPLLDAEAGYVLAPMARGLRLTTGAQFARLDAAPHPVQVARAEALARGLMDLGPALPEPPWHGARPCTADMLPVMGAAPRHPGLWFNFGHGHQGFTLGPVAGKLVAALVTGDTPDMDPAPYAPGRFGA
jgi:D-amino-acid dehydrogenase